MTADRLTLSVPQAVITAAKIRAIQDGTSLSAVVAAWLEAWGAGTHPAIVPATTASNERALLEENRAQVHRIAEQDALLARLRAQARQWRAGGPESGTHGARALTELAALSLQDDAALGLSQPPRPRAQQGRPAGLPEVPDTPQVRPARSRRARLPRRGRAGRLRSRLRAQLAGRLGNGVTPAMTAYQADGQTSAVLSEILYLANHILNEAFQCALSGDEATAARAVPLAAVAHERLYQYQIQAEQVHRFGTRLAPADSRGLLADDVASQS